MILPVNVMSAACAGQIAQPASKVAQPARRKGKRCADAACRVMIYLRLVWPREVRDMMKIMPR
jgi:hypothetical protein